MNKERKKRDKKRKYIIKYNLALLSKLFSLPWIVAGDFNQILAPQEKQGGRPLNVSSSLCFLQSMYKCNLHDLGFHCPKFTWCNQRYKGRCSF